MKTILVAVAVAGALIGGMVQAQDATKKCMGCHDMDKKKAGPAFKDVSAKYKGKKVDEVVAGMKGKPVHKGVLGKTNDASLKTMLEWVQKQ